VVRSNEKILAKYAILGVLLLTTIHVCLSLSLVDPHSGFFDFLHITTILILVIMFISILTKGLVPVAISCLGIVLLYGSIVIPAIDNSLGPSYYKASTVDL
jgi:prepilin signal peptidase PulO-like enzyme (type II secretory pathway)